MVQQRSNMWTEVMDTPTSKHQSGGLSQAGVPDVPDVPKPQTLSQPASKRLTSIKAKNFGLQGQTGFTLWHQAVFILDLRSGSVPPPGAGLGQLQKHP